MILFALAALAFQGSASIKRLLSNGDVVQVISRPGSRSISVALAVACADTVETPRTHGFRHILEHLKSDASGPDPGIQAERDGGFLYASTSRDCVIFKAVMQPGLLDEALDLLNTEVSTTEWPQKSVTSEARIIEREADLEGPADKMSDSCWDAVFGAQGLNPIGDTKLLASASAKDIERFERSFFVHSRMALVIDGNVDADDAAQKAAKFLGRFPPCRLFPKARSWTNGGVWVMSNEGAAVGIPTTSLRFRLCAAEIAAGLSLASRIQQGFFTYTPSDTNGLIVVGCLSNPVGLPNAVRNSDPAALYRLGMNLASRWIEGEMDDPQSDAELRSELLAESPSLRPEDVLRELKRVGYHEFLTALKRIDSALEGPAAPR